MGTKQSRSLLKVIMASIAIVYFLQNQRTSIKITCFFDILRKFDIHLSSNCNRSIYFEIFAIVFIAFFFIWLWKIFFLIGNYLFILLFYINCSPLLFLCRLNSSFLISTISFFFHKMWMLWKHNKACSPRSCTSSSLQGILMCEGWNALPISYNAINFEISKH